MLKNLLVAGANPAPEQSQKPIKNEELTELVVALFIAPKATDGLSQEQAVAHRKLKEGVPDIASISLRGGDIEVHRRGKNPIRPGSMPSNYSGDPNVEYSFY
ncbi:MAG: hypothetical protein OXR66_05735 [Candidatus Woesearchaeota archaeon]|nr:hypothetical protein [Candidatus Woesearchaeota archaeon]